MQKKFGIRHLLYIALLVCLLLGSSQAGMASADRDEWSADEIMGTPLAVQPIGTFIPIANNNSIYEYAPAVAHGGQYYMVVYLVGDGHVYANVRNNDGTFAASYLIDSSNDFIAPRITYHAPSGLFLVTYYWCGSETCNTRVKSVSPTGGIMEGTYIIFDAMNPDIACSQVDNVCLLAYHQQTSNPIRGRYFAITPDGLISMSERRNLSTENGIRPYLAWGSGTFRYMLTFTFTYEGVDYPVYNHLNDLETVGEDSYLNPTLYVLDSWTGFPNNKNATGVAYDPCTEHFLLLFDHDISGNQSQVNVWAAAIHKVNMGTKWFGPIADRTAREQSGGISFATDDNLPAACGIMNKLAVIYTNYDENRIYALEVSGNNNKTSPVYTPDEFDDHFLVANLGTGQPLARPSISSGSENGEMFLVFDILYTTASNIFGRLVHVQEPEEVFFTKIQPADGAFDQPLSLVLSWQEIDNIDRYEYCLGSISGTCNVKDWTNTGTNTSVIFDANPNTTNFWQVRAINAEGETFANDGTWWSFTTTSPGEQVTADFTASPTSGEAPLIVAFINLSTGDYETCDWDFGDGNASENCNNPSHTYQSNGTYTVKLTVSGDGGTDTKTQTDLIRVTAEGDPVTADFSASPTSGPAPLTVAFTNRSEGDYDTCTWNFGDGNASDICNNPSHIFQEEGLYTVNLTVSGGGGTDSRTRTNYIIVGDVGQKIFLPLILR